ncbi:MAG: Multidrug resistance operon repressor [Flavobacteriia bacterium]|jgi:DNA-binding MarR family transcriptional regulator|nr:MAG: Multidrug resistance operon repressor [Flavobacteriia bacterium]
MKPEETIDFHLKSAWQSLSRMYNDLAQSYGGTMATGHVLLSIDSKGTPSTALGPKMGMEATSLSRTLKVLEERQLIERSKHPSDGRVVLIHLTDEGKKMRAHARNAVIEFNSRIQELVAPSDLQAFFRVAQGITEFSASEKKSQRTI